MPDPLDLIRDRKSWRVPFDMARAIPKEDLLRVNARLFGHRYLMDRVVPGGNGVFRATVCVDGRVIGTWTRSLKRSEVVIDFTPFRPIDDRQRARVDMAFERYGGFLGLPVRLA